MNPLVAAGKLDRTVTIVRAGAPTRNSRNEEVPGAAVEKARWASVKPAPGAERFQSAENAASAVWRFVFRWEDDLVRVTDTLRTEEGRSWNVHSADPIGRNEGWDVLASARMESL
jgi:head-tail adaptor